ncbi:MAG: allose kinase [Eubacteriales bacterium]|nr:allose kinase [Eubacteriales bacterium]
MQKVIIGIDLGGTNLRIGAVNSQNQMVSPVVISSTVIADAEKPIEALCELIGAYLRDNHIEAVEAISIGVPSSVANDKQTVICTTNIRNGKGEVVFDHVNIAQDIAQRFGVNVYVNNDINNILLYDVMANHLESQQMVVGIYIGTGVGASVLVDGRLLEGKDGAELDLGHVPFFQGNEPCSCGKHGCCECYASGWRLQEIRKTYFPDTKIEDMFTLHREEKPMRDFVKACAHIYAVMATIFNPNSMIVGGGVMEMKDFPREDFEEAVNAETGTDVMSYGFQYIYSKPFVGKGVIGATLFARSRAACLTAC